MSPEQVKDIADAAADAAAEKAIHRIFLALGIDASDIKSMLEVQADLAHLRKWRKSIERVHTVSLGTAVTVVLTGVFAALWLGVKAMVGK